MFLRLKDSEGEVLSEIKVPWPDGEPEPCEVLILLFVLQHLILLKCSWRAFNASLPLSSVDAFF